jgi:hypothetical protein
MSDRVFVDTNLLAYLFDDGEVARRRRDRAGRTMVHRRQR